MQVQIQKLSPVLVEFAVEIPADRVKAEVERAYVNLARRSKIKGFRPGKAPRDVLQHVYGGQVQQDVAQRLVDDSLPKALAEKSVQPLATLAITPSKLNTNAAFSYKARFEVSPDIETVNYDGFEVKKPSTTVADEAITQQLDLLRQDHSTLRVPEPARPAKSGDVAVVDFDLSLDGKPVKDGSAKDLEMEIGSGRLIKEIDDALVGASSGDKKDVAVVFPEGHPRADFRGKNGTFHVTVKEVKERVLPELDNDFAKDVGAFETLDALKEDIKAKLEKTLNQAAEDAIAEQIVVELCKANPVPVPPSLVQRQFDITQQELAQRARRQGERLQVTEELRQNLIADSEMKVRAGLVMAAIAKEQQIKVTDEDIENAYVELADQTGKNVARLKAEYREQSKREILLGMILEDKILTLIQDKAKVTEALALVRQSRRIHSDSADL
jgi:trigger factor